uniref:PDZ domain-containing protein n=1 Tax=Rodentolepis nana TaxID=102285 RepID=A0A0R3T9D0_RODNA
LVFVVEIIGLKLVIGKRVPSDMVGTFVSSVKERSVADLMGELQTGDEILEWNGHNLRGLHQEEVSEILALSRNTDEVWLTVQLYVAQGAPRGGKSIAHHRYFKMDSSSSCH